MRMQNTYKGYWSIVKDKTRILVHPGQSNPYNPTSFIYNTDPPCKSKVDFYEIRKAVRSLYTEEQLFEYFCSITE